MEVVSTHRAIMGRGNQKNSSKFRSSIGQPNMKKILGQAVTKTNASLKTSKSYTGAVPFTDVTNRQRNVDIAKNKVDKSTSKIELTKKKAVTKLAKDVAVIKPTIRGKTALHSLKKFVKEEIPNGIENIDLTDDEGFGNPRYAKDIVNYTRNLELKYDLKEYLEKSDEKSQSRAILVDWLIQVQNYLKLKQQSLHLTIAIIDQVLAVRSVSLSKLQLLGISSLLVATKYEQLFAPRIQKLLHLTNDSYTHRQVIQMEMYILNTLKFQLCIPTPMIFMDRGFKAVQSDMKLELLTRYILDLGLSEIGMLKFAPSLRAASAIYLAKRILDTEQGSKDTTWFRPLCYYLGYTHVNLRECVQRMVGLLSMAKSTKYQGAREKYSHRMYEEVSQWNCIEDYVERKSTC